MDKLTFIQAYIDKCDVIINSKNLSEAEKLQDEIVGVFENDIANLTRLLDSYAYSDSNYVDYIKDIALLKQKLIYYAANIQKENERIDKEIELARLRQPLVSAHAEANPTTMSAASATSSVTITIEQTLIDIDKIPESELSDTDKEAIKEYLYSLDGIKNAKDKNKFWSKTKEVLKFISEKGFEVALAVLPYILTGLQT